ncbi:MAG: glucose-1-phosphate adenylyltransferase subunit GlgD [Erysipelotrichaceae bacterium]|nr:glucose-1-phosphate adenylyltransferase subunit GlgD [Erysipelotrichaceae bacterium]
MNRLTGIISTNYLTEDLGALSVERSGALVPFGGRYRLIDFVLSNMVNSAVDSIGIIAPFKYRSLIDHISSTKAWMLDKKHGGLYVLPGSAYGINRSFDRFLLRDFVDNKTYIQRIDTPYVLVTAANFVYNMNYEAMFAEHRESGADITMLYTIASGDDIHPTRLTVESDRVKGFSKGVLESDRMFMDCFIISRDFLLAVLEWYGQADYLDLFEALYQDVDKLYIRGYQYDGFVANVFSTANYFKYNMELLNHDVRVALFAKDAQIMTKVQDSPPATHGKNAIVKNSLIQSGCQIDGTVENSILSRKVKVEKGAIVKNCILFKSVHVESGAHIENLILDKNNKIKKNVTIIGSKNDIQILPKVEKELNI